MKSLNQTYLGIIRSYGAPKTLKDEHSWTQKNACRACFTMQIMLCSNRCITISRHSSKAQLTSCQSWNKCFFLVVKSWAKCMKEVSETILAFIALRRWGQTWSMQSMPTGLRHHSTVNCPLTQLELCWCNQGHRFEVSKYFWRHWSWLEYFFYDWNYITLKTYTLFKY